MKGKRTFRLFRNCFWLFKVLWEEIKSNVGHIRERQKVGKWGTKGHKHRKTQCRLVVGFGTLFWLGPSFDHPKLHCILIKSTSLFCLGVLSLQNACKCVRNVSWIDVNITYKPWGSWGFRHKSKEGIGNHVLYRLNIWSMLLMEPMLCVFMSCQQTSDLISWKKGVESSAPLLLMQVGVLSMILQVPVEALFPLCADVCYYQHREECVHLGTWEYSSLVTTRTWRKDLPSTATWWSWL